MFEHVTVQLKCPHCGISLMDKEHPVDGQPGIMLMISIGDERKPIWLSPIYGSYHRDSELKITDGVLALFFCPKCGDELVSDDVCEACGAPMVDFHLVEGGKMMICSRAGCKKHLVEFEDLNTALNHFYAQYDHR